MGRVSVLMCVYNTQPEYLAESMESILCQSFKDFEFIIMNDGSTNQKSLDVMYSYKDSRIKIYDNPSNIGLTKSLNRGLQHCNGKYIARMDADDISEPDRLKEQLLYAEHTGASVSGALCEAFPGHQQRYFFTENRAKQMVRMAFGNAGIVHSTAFLRHDTMACHNIKYNESYKRAQDYGLWCEYLSKGFPLYCCPKKLVRWRISDSQISSRYRKEQRMYARKIRHDFIGKNFVIPRDNLKTFTELIDDTMYQRRVDVRLAERVLSAFVSDNRKTIACMEDEVYRFWIAQARMALKRKNTRWLLSKMGFQSLRHVPYYLWCREHEKIDV